MGNGSWKAILFTLTAVIAALAGALYCPQSGSINPALVTLLSSRFTGGRVPDVLPGFTTLPRSDWRIPPETFELSPC